MARPRKQYAVSEEGISMRVRLLMLAALLTAAPAHAGGLAPKKPSDLRTVTTGLGCPGFSGSVIVDNQQNPDGTQTAFSIPAGSVFVVTSYNFIASAGPGLTASGNLFIPNGVGLSIVDVGYAATDTNGLGGVSVTTPNGIVVKSGSVLCATETSTVVHGFIAKDK